MEDIWDPKKLSEAELPPVSVVMPAYNASAYVQTAVRSVLAQTHRRLELVVVDDGSTDDTLAQVQQAADGDGRLRIVSGPHAGISRALNTGCEAAQHEWLAVMHADDVALPDRLQRQLLAARAQPEVLCWGSWAAHANRHGRVVGVSCTGPTTLEEYRARRRAGDDVYVIHPTMMFRRQTWRAIGGYRQFYDGAEDMDLCERVAERGPLLAVPRVLLLYRLHSQSVTMRSFFHMQQLLRYLRRRRALGGQAAELSWEEFAASEARRSWLSRAATSLGDLGRCCYRRAGIHWGERRAVAATIALAASALLQPHYALPRVWQQLLSRRANSLIALTRRQSPSQAIEPEYD